MNTCRIGNSVIFFYLALLSYTIETFGYLVNAPSGNVGSFYFHLNLTKNSVNDYPKDASKFISTPQQEMGQPGKHFKGRMIEDDRRVHTSKSEEDNEGEKEDEEIHPNDSDLSEEMDNDEINSNLSPAQLHDSLGSEEPQNDAVSFIHNSFISRKTFSCPKIKNDFVTGTDTGDLSPEDIGIIAAMGDSLATGTGLWPQTDIE
ncbi:unnamed protein product, partial [Brugia timori]|uniref:Lysophospholipase n=1 Tax=Brugia timori TaxID=42155 RepID=A0A0R3R7J6_9BILA